MAFKGYLCWGILTSRRLKCIGMIVYMLCFWWHTALEIYTGIFCMLTFTNGAGKGTISASPLESEPGFLFITVIVLPATDSSSLA
jgi:hypothetical protein